MDRFAIIDGMRGIAILGVYLLHSLGASFGTNQLPWKGLFRDFNVDPAFLILYPFTYGFSGVAIFFVLSGFCIHISHMKNHDRVWITFYLRRFFRIYPAYIVSLAIFFHINPWNTYNHESHHDILQAFRHILGMHNFYNNSVFGINPSLWSIAVEIQLYLLYPLLLFLAVKKTWKYSLIVTGCIEILFRTTSMAYEIKYANSPPAVIWASPLSYWFSWSIGAYLADCYLKKDTSRIFKIKIYPLMLFCFLSTLYKPSNHYSFLLFSLLTGTIVSKYVLQDSPSYRRLRITWLPQLVRNHLKFLGCVSYSFYLLHQPINVLMIKMLTTVEPELIKSPLTAFLICLIMYPLILLLSYITFTLIEKPAMRAGRAVFSWQ